MDLSLAPVSLASLDLPAEESELPDMALLLAAPLIDLFLLLVSLSANAAPASRLNIKASNNFFSMKVLPLGLILNLKFYDSLIRCQTVPYQPHIYEPYTPIKVQSIAGFHHVAWPSAANILMPQLLRPTLYFFEYKILTEFCH